MEASDMKNKRIDLFAVWFAVVSVLGVAAGIAVVAVVAHFVSKWW
jgi:hypothetical protein